jgi:nitrite reductase/ring-hydroxylating ferredoxin subunit
MDSSPSPAIASSTTWLAAGATADIRARRVVVVKTAAHPIAVFAVGDGFRAVDNRCPHLGFPLHQGTVKDGILTCHWHHANFDLRSGCAFDPWADDIPAHAVRVVGDAVEVAAQPVRIPDRAFHRERLRRGLDQDLGLLQAKSLIGLLGLGDDPTAIVREALLARLDNLRDASGLIDLALAASLQPQVSAQTGYLLLARGLGQLASASRNNRRPVAGALDGVGYGFPELRRWFRQFVADRHGDGAERILLTAIAQGSTPAELVELIVGTAAERVYANQGHVVDFANQACALLDRLGWEHAARVLPLVIPLLVEARGAEEDGSWHHPAELIAPLLAAEAGLRDGSAPAPAAAPVPERIVAIILGDDPLLIIATLAGALRGGASPAELARLVCYAAARRLAHFASANEVGDWFNPRHTFTFANAVHQAIVRAPVPDVARSLLHAALAVYQDRFLNVPPARLPQDDPQRDALPVAADALLRLLLETLDGRSSPERAGLIVSRYLQQGHAPAPLMDALAFATVREDLDFHPFQTLEAGLRQARDWAGRPEAEHLLVAVARSLAAVCPTPRARLKTALIAQRLQRGDRLHEG